MAFAINPSIALGIQERDFGRGFDRMQDYQAKRLELDRLREQFNEEKEARLRQKQMRQGIASELLKMQQGTPAQYKTDFVQTMPTGQMPQGMTGVLASERGQNLPAPDLFGENILKGNFDTRKELVSPAVQGVTPDYMDILNVSAKNALQVGDVDSFIKFSSAIQQAKTASDTEWGTNPTKGINPNTGKPDSYITNRKGEVKWLGSGIYEPPKETKAPITWTVPNGRQETVYGYDANGKPVVLGVKSLDAPNQTQPRIQQVTDATGTYLVDLDTGQTKPIMINGKPATPAKAVQTPSGEESNAAGFYVRMKDAEDLLAKYEEKGKPNLKTTMAANIPIVGDVLERSSQTPEQQQYKNAALAWIRAKLRKESGAAIGVDEAEQEYKNYFPVVGDTKEVIEQKRQLRSAAMDEMGLASGKAYQKAEDIVTSRRNVPDLSKLPTTNIEKNSIAKDPKTGKPIAMFNGSKWIPWGGQ